uniref:Uncharacterized protein n=1 Tax=Anopheles culicifacies TaxID=139723 RepID=A0A182M004_9DIPT
MTFSRQFAERVTGGGQSAEDAGGGVRAAGTTRCSKGHPITSRTMSSGSRRRNTTVTSVVRALGLCGLLAMASVVGASYSDTDDLINELDRPSPACKKFTQGQSHTKYCWADKRHGSSCSHHRTQGAHVYINQAATLWYAG